MVLNNILTFNKRFWNLFASTVLENFSNHLILKLTNTVHSTGISFGPTAFLFFILTPWSWMAMFLLSTYLILLLTYPLYLSVNLKQNTLALSLHRWYYCWNAYHIRYLTGTCHLIPIISTSNYWNSTHILSHLHKLTHGVQWTQGVIQQPTSECSSAPGEK